HLHQAGAAHFSDQRKYLRAGTLRTAGFREPGGTQGHDGGDVVPGLHIVNVGGLAPEPLVRREWRPWPRPSRTAFERSDQGRFLSANKGARTLHEFDVELEPAAQDVVAQNAVFPRLLDRAVQPVDGQGILRADIDDAFRRAHHVSADDHAFDQRVRIAFDFIAIHVRAGIALVGVTDDVLLVGLGLGHEFPLISREISSAAPSTQLGSLDLFEDVLRAPIDQDLVQGLITSDGDVFFDVIGIDEPAIPQNDFLLSLKEGHVVPQRNLRVAAAIFQLRGDVIPLLDLAVRQVVCDVSAGKLMQDAHGVIRLHAVQDNQWKPRQTDIYKRFLKTSAETPDARQNHVHPAPVNGLGEGAVKTFGAIPTAARAHANGDAWHLRHQFCHSRFADGSKCSNILNSRHHSLPRSIVWISRCSVRSFAWPQMW